MAEKVKENSFVNKTLLMFGYICIAPNPSENDYKCKKRDCSLREIVKEMSIVGSLMAEFTTFPVGV